MVNQGKPYCSLITFSVLAGGVFAGSPVKAEKPDDKRPNILFAIADDQSFPYASAYGMKGVHTSAFDEVVKKGVIFTNAFVGAPQCSPSRAAILTGKNIWQLEEAGTHSSYFPKKLVVFTDLLEKSGYQIGFTGKPWSPGNWKDAGWARNPVGPEYNTKTFKTVPAKGISKTDYFENFKEFYSKNDRNKPFFFWYGGHEPHREYEEGSGLKSGKLFQMLLSLHFYPILIR
jgi:N-sulfoglucosamine sulfohydrolase